MADRPFVHLHCHSHYSLLDGASRIPELIARVKSQGMNAVAITDHGNLYGAIEFYRECKDNGVNPVIGYEAYVAPAKRTERDARRRGDAGFHLTLLAKNVTGFKNLVKMASSAYLDGYHYVPRIDKELLEAHKDGLICLSGCASSEFSEFILKDQHDEATRLAEWFAHAFGDNFYVEIQNNGLDIQKQCADGAIAIANKLGLPLVATSDAHYLTEKDAYAHDVLLCINTGKTIKDENRMRYGSNLFYVRGPEEMYGLFPGMDEAVKRSQEIADGVHIELDFKKRHFPVFRPPAEKTPDDYLRELCFAGLKDRYGDSPSKTVLDRLEHELGIICRMGFASYFLIVSDFVRFAVEKGIPCSARGSGCGALVSYVLKLSHVDPLEYDLLFERFLDPNRAEAPDIDIDFCQDRREEVIAYVRQKYGEESVAQIATFGTLGAKAAIKDVGRALDVPLERVTQLTAMIPTTLGATIDDGLEQNADLRKLNETDSEVRHLLDVARRLEGTNRQSGVHAAGVVISNGPLTDYVPLQKAIRKGDDAGSRSGEAVVTTQWVMGDLEKVGLLKMDFLGLRTLTLLTNAVAMIEKTRGMKLDLYRLPPDDPETYQLLQRGDAKGVFQLESDGIRELLKRMKPDNIRDIIALMALYRPGPLEGGMVDAYVNRKHGREKPTYDHPIMEEVLAETYGVMVYQEQIMRLLNKLGGIELSSAYACIKAISKKKHDIIEQRRVEFVKGAVDRGVAKETADEIFRLITVFGGYGFNKSHSAAYAQLGYQTAYLKRHFTAEFMAALLSSEIEDGNKRDVMVDHIADARRLGVEVLPPCVNASDPEFTVVGGKIVFGLTAIKGVGRQAAEEVGCARVEGGRFKDLFDFCDRVDHRLLNRAAMERLVKAGAMDAFRCHRAQLMHLLGGALQAAAERQQDKKLGQRNLFDSFESSEAKTNGAAAADLPTVELWPEAEKLKYEKEVLDFYFSSHPLAHAEKEIRRYTTHTVEQLRSLQDQTEVTIGGMFSQLRLRNVKNPRNGNSQMARCKVQDFSGIVEALMWPDDFARHKNDFAEDRVYVLKGVVEMRTGEPILVLSRAMSLDTAREELASKLWLRMSLARNRQLDVDAVAQALKRSPGKCPVFLDVCDATGRHCVVKLGTEFWVNPKNIAQDELETILGADNVKLI